MSDFLKTAEQLRQQYGNRLPPVDKWNPDPSGKMDMLIDRQGRWFHEGEEIRRLPLVKLFASILKKEGDHYFLVTPVEKWQITVEDAPFYVVGWGIRDSDGNDLDVSGDISGLNNTILNNDDTQLLTFTTLTGDFVVVDGEHPLWVEGESPEAEPSPYVLVRNDMSGLISRPVYYQLVELALNSRPGDESDVCLYSGGKKFPLMAGH